MDTLDRADQLDDVSGPVGPALPSAATAQKTETLENHELPYDVVNGVPCYQQNHVVNRQVQIFERIGYDDRVGGTFLGLSPDQKELVVRVAPVDELTHVVRAEAAFLCKVEAESEDWRLFSQVHKIFMTDDAFHLTLYFRGGPTLEQCFAMRNKFTYGTAGRLGNDVLNIIRCAHKHGYLLRNVNMDCFHFDAASRRLFQADISSLIKNMETTNPIASYLGSLDYAPLAHHAHGHVGGRHDLESWFYQLLHMVLGELPWAALNREEAGTVKAELRESKVFKELPEQFHQIAAIAFASPDVNPTEAEFAKLSELMKEIYEELGGVADDDDNMDFEREPTEDEIPRLVMCRDQKEEEGQSEPAAENGQKETMNDQE